MTINDISIFKIDLQDTELNPIDHTSLSTDFDEYLRGLIDVIVTGSSGREFRFDSTTSEVRSQIGLLFNGGVFSDISTTIASRLLRVEKIAQEGIAHLNTQIQRGILVQALITVQDVRKFIICKADHHEFLNEESFRLARGLPIKKRVFKGFICDLSEGQTLSENRIYDQLLSKYWWSDFMELTKVFSDEDNTENAFDTIEKQVLLKLKKDHPNDYTHLSNSSIRYFRSKDAFDLDDYINDVFDGYEPFDATLNMAKVKEKLRDMPTKSGKPFDSQFSIVKSKIKKRIVRDIPLTPHIDLHLKTDVPELDTVVTAVEDPDGTKFVKIRSEQGWKYFKKTDSTEN